MSHHLKVMREAGVLGSEKVGEEVGFWVERDALATVLDGVSHHLRDHA